jgi:hypothetical protein
MYPNRHPFLGPLRSAGRLAGQHRELEPKTPQGRERSEAERVERASALVNAKRLIRLVLRP